MRCAARNAFSQAPSVTPLRPGRRRRQARPVRREPGAAPALARASCCNELAQHGATPAASIGNAAGRSEVGSHREEYHRGVLLRADRVTVAWIRHRVLVAVGFGVPPVDKQWIRIVMNLGRSMNISPLLAPETRDAVEIGGRNHEARRWKSYSTYERFLASTSATHPPTCRSSTLCCANKFSNICSIRRRALVRTLHDLAGGIRRPHIVVTTPFLYHIHYVPEDYWRFTRDGMTVLLESAGLRVLTVATSGNRSAARAVIRRDPALRFRRSLRDDPSLPVVVWAIAQRP